MNHKAIDVDNNIFAGSSMDCFLDEGGACRKLEWDSFTQMTPRDLLAGPYIIHIEIPGLVRFYFTEDEDVFHRLQGSVKEVLRLSTAFEIWQKALISGGKLSPGTSIYSWPFGEVLTWLQVFREPIGDWEGQK